MGDFLYGGTMYILSKKEQSFKPFPDKDVEFICIPPTREVILKLQEYTQEDVYNILQEGKELTEAEINLMSLKAINKIKPFLIDTCVVGWKNVVDEDGNPIPFSKDQLKYLNDADLIDKLVGFIEELAHPKNSKDFTIAQ